MKKISRKILSASFLLWGMAVFCVSPLWGAQKIIGKYQDALGVYTLTLATNDTGGKLGKIAAITTKETDEKTDKRIIIVFDKTSWKVFCQILKRAHNSRKPMKNIQVGGFDALVPQTNITIGLDTEGEIVLNASDAHGGDLFTLSPHDYAAFDRDTKKITAFFKY